MSLDVYSHAIVPDELAPESLKAVLIGSTELSGAVAVMHG
jgi:hypothetical protein